MSLPLNFREVPNSIPPSLATLLQKIEFISIIKTGEKICTNTGSFVDALSWGGSVYRAIHGESRQGNIRYIANIIEEAIRGFDDFPNHRRILISTIIRCKRGVENMFQTYNEDPLTTSTLTILLANIELQITRYGHLTTEPRPPIPIPIPIPVPTSNVNISRSAPETNDIFFPNDVEDLVRQNDK